MGGAQAKAWPAMGNSHQAQQGADVCDTLGSPGGFPVQISAKGLGG